MTSRISDGAKRAGDVAVSAVGLVLTAPLQMTLAVLVRRDLGTPVVFRQQRPGRGGIPFTLLKFRTMRAPSEGDGPSRADAAPDDEERLTGFGRWLRSTSLDELPSLWNVLVGDMSLVGPRPLLMEYLDLYTERQARRHEVRPGVTGLAQVSGRNHVDWADRLELDVVYVETRSLAVDLRILARTVRTVLSRQGVAQHGRATMEPFRGTAAAVSGERSGRT